MYLGKCAWGSSKRHYRKIEAVFWLSWGQEMVHWRWGTMYMYPCMPHVHLPYVFHILSSHLCWCTCSLPDNLCWLCDVWSPGWTSWVWANHLCQLPYIKSNSYCVVIMIQLEKCPSTHFCSLMQAFCDRFEVCMFILLCSCCLFTWLCSMKALPAIKEYMESDEFFRRPIFRLNAQWTWKTYISIL